VRYFASGKLQQNAFIESFKGPAPGPVHSSNKTVLTSLAQARCPGGMEKRLQHGSATQRAGQLHRLNTLTAALPTATGRALRSTEGTEGAPPRCFTEPIV
jgi:hypothetical protein